MSNLTLAAVLAQLHAGAEFRYGGGRWNVTFAWKDGKLVQTTFDEGLVTKEDVTEAVLAAAIESNPEDFRRS